VPIVVGYHACQRDHADVILRDRNAWQPSRNAYDWLGDGIYFWENNLRRAREWARDVIQGPSAILRAEIDLGRCLDLAETEFLREIEETHRRLLRVYRENGWKLPQNRDVPRGSRTVRWTIRWLDQLNTSLYRMLGVEFRRFRDQKLRYLDRLVIGRFLEELDSRFSTVQKIQTVRCPFEEGDPIFPGSAILDQTHVQIAVRDPTCIKQVAREV